MTEEFETSGSSSFMESGVRAYRALMLLARDDPETALEETVRSVELAHRAKDPQVLHPALGTYAVVRSRLGLLDEATQAADELLEDWSQGTMLGTAEWLLDLAYVLVPLGRLDDLEQALGRVKLDFPWLRAARAYSAGDPAAAAEGCSARSATGRTRPTCVSYRESTATCVRQSTSSARSARPGTCARAKRRWRRPHERDARRAQGRHRPLLRPGRVHLFFRSVGSRGCGGRAARLPRTCRRRAGALRRHRGEVHRGRGHGPVRRAGRARGRSRAGRARRARDSGLGGRGGRARGTDRDHDRRGARLARRPSRGGTGDGFRRCREHGRAAPGSGARQRHPRGRDDVPRDRARDRLRGS